MSDVLIRRAGRAGRITLNRPAALNALTWDMCLEIERALDAWRDDAGVALVIVDGAGEKAFCAGGDIAEMYRRGRAGDLEYGRRFWTDEYRLNAKIAEYPKPYVAFLHGFVMGGGVGVACHGSHRIVGETARIAMPECAIGLIPDVGGTHLLARAPGRLGEYMAVTGYRMGPGDAIHAGFADSFVPAEAWPGLIAALEETGDIAAVAAAGRTPPPGALPDRQNWAARHFAAPTLVGALASLDRDHGTLSAETRKTILTASPLAAACAYEAVGRVRGTGGIRRALETEYRFTFRCVEESDFLEGIRAAIVDKDRAPRWRHEGPEEVTPREVAHMLGPLGADRLSFEERQA